MQESDINKHLNKLKNINEVDVPPFLFTRVQQKIQNEYLNDATPKLKWSLLFGLALLVTLNILVGINQTSSREDQNLSQSFQLLPDNNLYK
jgi:hypothetical protein